MRSYITWVLVASIVTSPTLLQAGVNTKTQAANNVTLVNVELQADGSAVGQLVTDSGLAVTGMDIKVHDQKDVKQVSSKATTDKSGQFVINNLNSGTLVLSVGNESFACRVWQHGTAPPKSLTSFALVAGSDVVRGQDCVPCKPTMMQRLRCMSAGQKLGLGLVVAAAIALPIVLNDDEDNAS